LHALIPNAVFTSYVAHLNTGIEAGFHAEYKKWLRYYLDCEIRTQMSFISSRVVMIPRHLKHKKAATWLPFLNPVSILSR
jgi:hypothetical protein